MFFLYENILFALLIPLIFFLFSLKQSQSSMRKVFSKSILDQLSLHTDRLQSHVRYRLFLLVLSLFILSLARPVINEKNISSKQELIPVVIALDVSKSMHQNDIYPNRLTFAREKLKKLISKSLDMSIGILFFDKNAYMGYPISEDIGALEFMLDHLSKEQKFEAGSNIFAALEAGTNMLRDYKGKNIIILSDGGNSDDVADELLYLKKYGVTLYAIGIGAEKATLVSDDYYLSSKLNPTLEKLALGSGGIYEDFSWSNNDINSILAHIKKDSQKEQESQYQLKQYTELFFYPLALGIFLLSFVFSSPFKIRKEISALFLVLLFSLLSPQTKLHAGLLDFMTLHKAKTLYDEQKYAQSSELYNAVAKNSEGYYNLANALYKAKKYKGALSMYKKSLSKNESMQAQILHNIGNCYVQMNALNLAKKYYEKALKSARNRVTVENLSWVEKTLKEQEKKRKGKKEKLKVPRMCKTIAVGQIDFEAPPSSKYEIRLKDLALSEEKRWMKRVQKQQEPIYLKKIKTERMSHNVEHAW